MSMPMSTMDSSGGLRSGGTAARWPIRVASVPAAYPLRSIDSAMIV
jgi:hypothetical protein